MPRLMHPQHAIHALDGATGSDRPAQHPGHLPVGRPPVGVELLTEHLLHQRGHRAIAPECLGVRASRPPPTQPPQVDQRRAELHGQSESVQLLVQPIQEGQRRLRGEQPTDLGPFGARQPGPRRSDPGFGPRSVVELSIGPKYTQRRLGAAPRRLRLLIRRNAASAFFQAVWAARAGPRPSRPCRRARSAARLAASACSQVRSSRFQRSFKTRWASRWVWKTSSPVSNGTDSPGSAPRS